MPLVDFKEIRERLPIEDVAQMLPLKWDWKGEQMRSTCPVHGGERGLIVTPSKGLFVCQAAPQMPGVKRGGDCIELCAHVMQMTVYEAGKYLTRQMGGAVEQVTVNSSTVSKSRATGTADATAPQKNAPGTNQGKPFDPDAFARRLKYTDEVAKLGFSEEDAERFTIGFCQGRVYIPVRHPNGDIAGFVGWNEEGLKVPKQWLSAKEAKLLQFKRA